MACRVISKPALSLAIDIGPSSQRRETRPSLVSSPRAAKSAAEPAIAAFALTLRALGKVLLDHLDHHRPALAVGGEGLGPPRKRDLIESRLRDGQHDAARRLRQAEDDERRRLARVVDARLDRVGMPAEREHVLRFDPFDRDFERLACVRFLSLCDLGVDGSRGDHAAHRGAGHERAVEPDPEPVAELPGVGQRLPHPGARCAEQYFLLDTIRAGDGHMQPPGCLWYPGGAPNATSWLLINGSVSAIRPDTNDPAGGLLA